MLLDSHYIVWLATNPSVLTDAERLIISHARRPLVISTVSIWELRLKWHTFDIQGRRKGPIDPTAVIRFASALRWEFLPITARHAAASLDEPLAHKDPFDELLLVQAQEEGLLLLTRDIKLAGHRWAYPISRSS